MSNNTYPTLRPITQCSVSICTRLEWTRGAPRRPWMVTGNRGVTSQNQQWYPSPVALQP
jgi:hypothetical protein